MSRQNKIATKLRVARVHSDRRIAERKAAADKKRREEEARLAAIVSRDAVAPLDEVGKPEPVAPEDRCEMCGDSGVVQVERIEYVTRDMAIDAGTPELEGQPVPQGFENMPCPACTERETESVTGEGNG